MRRRLAAGEVPQPRFGTSAAEVGFPCVVKPTGLSGSQGVIRCDTPAELEAAPAADRGVLGRSADRRGVRPGVEVALEGLLRDGALEVLAVFDKPDALEGPYFEETIYVTPSRHPASTLALVAPPPNGPRTRSGSPRVRCTPRCGSTATPVRPRVGHRGRGAVDRWALRAHAALRRGHQPRRGDPAPRARAAARRARARGVRGRGDDAADPRAGTLVEVRGRDDALAVDGIVGLEITVPLGRTITPLPDGDRYLGFLFARAETPAAVEAALREAAARIDMVIT